MRVGLDVRVVTGRLTGIEAASAQLVAAVAAAGAGNEYVLFGSGPPTPHLRQVLRHPGVVYQPIGAGSDVEWVQLRLPTFVEKCRVELLHSTAFFLPVARTRGWACAKVVSIYDVIFRILPETFRPEVRDHFDRWTAAAATVADHIVVPSQCTARDLAQCYSVPRDRITVVPLGPGPHIRRLDPATARRAARRYVDDGPFMLCVSTVGPRKNHARLLRAYAGLGRVPHRLVLAGLLDRPGDIPRLIRELGLEGRVVLCDHVPDHHLNALINAADIFVYPSLYEGFGMPVLEAMACGVPVAASSTSALPEVVGDAGLLFDPRDTGSMVEALATLVEDRARREQLREAGLRRAPRFVWGTAARQVLDLYGQLHRAAPNSCRSH
jgi:glycosyltransferase involved in cell wall biosynthesis